MTDVSCGAETSLWQTKPGEIPAHAQPTSLKTFRRLIAAQSTMGYCLLMNALNFAATRVMKIAHTVTVDQPPVNSNQGLQKHQTYVLLQDVKNTAPARRNILEANFQ